MAKTKTAKTGGGGALIWVQGLACGAMAALAPGIALQVVTLLAPVLVAAFLDRQPGKPVARTMLLFALAASVDPIRAAWVAGHGVTMALDQAMDMENLASTWATAGAGWLLTQIIPMVAEQIVGALARARAEQLRRARAGLVETWGLDAPHPDPVQDQMMGGGVTDGGTGDQAA